MAFEFNYVHNCTPKRVGVWRVNQALIGNQIPAVDCWGAAWQQALHSTAPPGSGREKPESAKTACYIQVDRKNWKQTRIWI